MSAHLSGKRRLRWQAPSILVLSVVVVTFCLSLVTAPLASTGASAESGSCFFSRSGLIPDGHKWYPLKVATTYPSAECPDLPVRIVELRGWLWRDPEVGCNYADIEPDFHYGLELDSAWAVSRGIDLDNLLPVGNILQGSVASGQPFDPYAAVTNPIIHVELIGWAPTYPHTREHAPEPPLGWSFTNFPDCPDVTWPFDPLNPIPSQAPIRGDGSQYVRLVGGLVTDIPHDEEGIFWTWLCVITGNAICIISPGVDMNAASVDWGGYDEFNPQNVARPTELHPPDLIQILAPRAHKETLVGVALYSSNCFFFPCRQRGYNGDIRPPGRRPGPDWVAGYKRIVSVRQGLETNFVTTYADHIHVDISVRGAPFWGIPGKYKSFFRVFWVKRQATPPPPLLCTPKVHPPGCVEPS